MIVTMNIHDVSEVLVERYNHAINALVFAFICHKDGRQETTTFGIKPAAAIKIMSVLGTENTRIYYKDKLLTIDQYIDELAVQKVFEALEGIKDEA